MKAHLVGKLQGKRVYRWEVTVTIHDLAGKTELQAHTVLAPTAADALWHVRREPEFLALLAEIMRPVELVTTGQKGGSFSHFLGWESVTATLMAGHWDQPTPCKLFV